MSYTKYLNYVSEINTLLVAAINVRNNSVLYALIPRISTLVLLKNKTKIHSQSFQSGLLSIKEMPVTQAIFLRD